MVEEMLQVSPEWNEVPNLMMEDEDILLEAEGYTKRREMKLLWDREHGGRKIISILRNVYIRPQCLRGH